MTDPVLESQLAAAWDFFRAGFDQINVAAGLFVAGVAALLMSRFSRLPVVAAIALFATLALDALVPYVQSHEAIKLPPVMDPRFWWPFAAALFAGYLVVIGIFYGIKRVILRTVQ